MSLLSAFLFAISFFSAYEVAQPFTSLNKLKTKEDPCLNSLSSFWNDIVNDWLPNLCVNKGLSRQGYGFSNSHVWM